jgi:hypothetical protein
MSGRGLVCLGSNVNNQKKKRGNAIVLSLYTEGVVYFGRFCGCFPRLTEVEIIVALCQFCCVLIAI